IGRMDLLALLFFLLAYLLLIDSRTASGRAAPAFSAASGVLASLGVLTTPRPGYVLVPLGLIPLARCRTGPITPRVAQLVAWGIGFVPLVIVWIGYAFGGLRAMLAYFSEFAETYAGTCLATVSIQKPILAILFALTVLTLVRQPRRLLHELPVLLG